MNFHRTLASQDLQSVWLNSAANPFDLVAHRRRKIICQQFSDSFSSLRFNFTGQCSARESLHSDHMELYVTETQLIDRNDFYAVKLAVLTGKVVLVCFPAFFSFNPSLQLFRLLCFAELFSFCSFNGLCSLSRFTSLKVYVEKLSTKKYFYMCIAFSFSFRLCSIIWWNISMGMPILFYNSVNDVIRYSYEMGDSCSKQLIKLCYRNLWHSILNGRGSRKLLENQGQSMV